MPIFEYQATDAAGVLRRGVANGTSMDAVAQELARQGLSLQSLRLAAGPGAPMGAPMEVPTAPTSTPAPSAAPSASEDPLLKSRSRFATDVYGPIVGQVGLAQLQFFFQQLATMLKAGVALVQSLDTLSTQTQSPKLRAIIRELKVHAMEGRPLSQGLSRYPEVFSPIVLSMVYVGEQGGFLDRSLQLVAQYIKQDLDIRMAVRRATLWPKITFASIFVVIFAANAVIAAVAPGRAGLSHPLQNPALWIPLVILIAGGFFALRIGLRRPQFQLAWHTFTSNLPGIRGIVRQFAMAKFGRAFGALYTSGVGIPVAMKLAADACGNEMLRRKIYQAVPRLEDGQGIHETMAATGAFNPIVLDMARTGEATGNMDEMMTSISEFYEAEALHNSNKVALILGVVALLVVAAYILFILVRFYTGYFDSMFQRANSI